MREDGLICAYHFDGHGHIKKLKPSEVEASINEEGFTWVHMNYHADAVQVWLRNEAGLDMLSCEALLAKETRPRVAETERGTLLFLRAVNMDPASEPEDMISIRMWIEPKRVISVRMRKLKAVDDLRHGFETGKQIPRVPGELIAQLTRMMLIDMETVVSRIEDIMDDVEARLLKDSRDKMRHTLADQRTRTIELRRYIAPQRDVITQLMNSGHKWLNKNAIAQLREDHDIATRLVETLDVDRERAAIMQEELRTMLSDQLNRNIYTLSIISAIFLPLHFVAGVLGMNVNGIPYSHHPDAFFFVLGLMSVAVGIQIMIFKRLRLF